MNINDDVINTNDDVINTYDDYDNYHNDNKFNLNNAFIPLSKHPSFTSLSLTEKEVVSNLLCKTVSDAENGKWLIPNNEIIVEYPAFAKGSFSSVHNCDWRGSKIAVKKPIYQKISNIMDFLQEIQVWHTLRHPNLVQFLGISLNHIEDEITILMEKVSGNNLKDFIENNRSSYAISRKRYIISQIITVIKFLHNCNPPVVYRDLKPENILIDKNYNIKLTDFGLSKYFHETDDDDSYAMTGNTGTLRYMAPEVYFNKKYNLNVDVYSLGLIIYYIYTDERPFNNYTVELMNTYFKSEDLIMSTKKIKDRKVRSIVNKCIDKDPVKRFNINNLLDEWNNMCEIKKDGNCTIS